MEEGAPYSAFITKKLKDTCQEMGCLKVLMEYLPAAPEKIWDVMGGVGFVAKLMESRFPSSQLHLNDWSPECAQILAANFPRCNVTQGDGLELLRNLSYQFGSVIWIDFNNFGWAQRDKYREWMEVARETARTMVFTDSSVWGMTRFNGKNLRTYGVGSIDEYFRGKLSPWLAEMGWQIRAVTYFNNASFILCRGVCNNYDPNFPIIPNPPPLPILPLKS